MALQRTSWLTHFLRPATTNPSFIIRRYAGNQHESAQNVEGESGKSPKQAQPKIFGESPPNEGEASQEVKDHNKDMDKRAERPAEKVKDEDVEKDKVGKGFWGEYLHFLILRDMCPVLLRVLTVGSLGTSGKDGAQGGTS